MKKCLFSILSILITLSNYAQNVGINTTPSSPPTNTLDINGTLRVRGGTPATGKVLTSDANGVGSWTTPSANYPRISYDAILALPSPTKGDIAYDTTFDCLRVYTGSKWICTYQNPANYTPNMIAIASAGGIGSDASYSIAVDGTGNVYVTGYYAGTATFGTTSITSAGSIDMFVAKYNNTGSFQWVQSAGGALEDVGNSIAVDGSGNVYVTGGYKGTAIFGTTPKTSAGISDVFVVKYNSSGTFQWVQSAGGTNDDIGNGIALDVSGNIYVTGGYFGTATFGTTPIFAAGNADIFLVKYNSSGFVQWVQTAGGSNFESSKSIAVDISGNVYMTGYYFGTTTFGVTSKTSTGSADIFVAKYDPSGASWLWLQSAGGTIGNDYGQSIALDASGNVYITGYYFGTVTFGTTSITSAGSNEIFVTKYNNSGAFQWVQSAGGTNNDVGNSVAVDGSGNVYVTGYYYGTTFFGANPKTSAGSADVFVVKYNSNGTFQWIQSSGGIGEDSGNSIALDTSGNVYLTGFYGGTATFGSTTFTSSGNSDIFVSRLDK